MGVFIPVHSICSIRNPVLCNILPAAHAITRCDSTSSLFGISKRTVFKVLEDSPENFRDLSTLADCDTDKSIDAASKDLSVSQSARVDKSLKFSGLSLSTLKTVRLPIPNKDDVESHLVMAYAAGKMLHETGLRMLQIECTGIKTPILGVCDRTRMKP
jgi:hypothetical protein